MDLETLLPAIRSLHDLPRLVAALGHQPLWEHVPEVARRGRRAGREVTVVGRTGELPWLAFETLAPERDAHALAEHRSRGGQISLVFGFNPLERRLAVAIGFGGFPVLGFSLARPPADGVTALGRLAGPADGGYLAFAAKAADALATETVGRRFFRAFRATLEEMAAGLRGAIPPAERESMALLQLTRVLFLYFVQNKGWLGGRERFLAEEVDGCLRRRRRIHRDLLRPLFFGTLNCPISARSRTAARFGAIPFLNGGLFEPHPLERKFRADLSNEVWREAFDGLFERFHFTASESGVPGAIAPDMLGRVFEGVMAPDARRASGTYYTPAALVGAVLHAALIALLSDRLGCTEAAAERRLRDPDLEVRTVLRSVTILDPAVGSGAFLVGALDYLARLDSGPDLPARKRAVLERNLFGVDQSMAAVRLTELRLWLAVIADDPSDRAEQVNPLPNLDCLIRQGDSLFDPVGISLGAGHRDPVLVAEISKLRCVVVGASGAAKKGLVRKLRAVECRMVNESLASTEQRLQTDIADCVGQARGPDLFGNRRGLDCELGSRLRALRVRLHAVHQARRTLHREGGVPWFHYQSHFADVFERGGFDIVLGNPPWLRSEEIPGPMRARLTARYRWWRASGGSYGNRPDLAVAFLERAFELTRAGGVIAMIVPAKLAKAQYGAAFRHAIASTATLHLVADLTGDPRARFEAMVYPLALVARKSTPPPQWRVGTALGGSRRHRPLQAGLRGGEPWILVPGVADLIAALEQEFPTVSERFSCHLGLKTGANRVFLNPPDDLEPDLLRWAVRGRDLRPFCCRPRTRLLWTHDGSGHPLRALPPRCARYLKAHLSELKARKDFGGGPPWTVFRARPAVAPHRVVWADLARQLTAVALTTSEDLERVPLNSCYVTSARCAAEAEKLSAWLNSTWIRALARLKAVPAASGFARYNAQAIAALPLPESVLTDSELTRLARAGRTAGDIQEQLDRLVAGHLRLTETATRSLLASVGCSTRHRS
ncbi:MAG TPA: N-6 DNA methylase [Gemmatimonadales bacterium]